MSPIWQRMIGRVDRKGSTTCKSGSAVVRRLDWRYESLTAGTRWTHISYVMSNRKSDDPFRPLRYLLSASVREYGFEYRR